ncbi:5-hydroxytryptamine receptor 3A-like [Pelobates cultripes]|uniref:5-hydroxytryptamine receptor 3A n=1 Tax=Pelobates cultripes TaxID=61616 RepID=A0AAD1WSF1_PELCU|nr:5-hydroxytryptamine receptor 3A-like [Pelobates cultripes]
MSPVTAWIYFGLWSPLISYAATQENRTLKYSKSAVARLTNDLMDGYQKEVRPVRDWRKPTIVYIDFLLYAILGVNEKRQMLSTYIWYKQIWKDEFLTWDPKDYDNNSSKVYSWSPSRLMFEAAGDADIRGKPRWGRLPEELIVNNEGRVLNSKPMQIVTTCNLNIYYFPFDVQNCTFTFTSWIHKLKDINVSLHRTPEEMNKNISFFHSDGEWDLLELFPYYNTFKKKYSEIKINICFKRRPIFYIVHLILPSMFLIIMDIIAFYVPPESGERISCKITILLGYSVFLIIVSDHMPATSSGTPLIGVYFIVCMALLLFSIAESIFIVRVVFEERIQPEVPDWVKKLVLEKMAAMLCRQKFRKHMESCYNSSHVSWEIGSASTEKLSKRNDVNAEDSTEEILQKEANPGILDKILKEIAFIRSNLEKKDKNAVTREWLLVAYILDVFMFRVYLLAVLAYLLSLSLIWSRWQLA